MNPKTDRILVGTSILSQAVDKVGATKIMYKSH